MTLSGHFLQMPDGTLVKAEADTEIDFEDNIIYRYVNQHVRATHFKQHSINKMWLTRPFAKKKYHVLVGRWHN